MSAPETTAEIKILKPGVYDLSDEVYHGDPVAAEPSLSAGVARLLIDATPLHAWAESPRLNPEAAEGEQKSAFDLGRAAHAALTGKGGAIVRVDANDWRTNAAKEARDAAYAEGKTPLLAEQADRVRAVVVAARRQMRAHGIGDPFEGGLNERSLFWKAGGVWNRAKVDCLDLENRVQYDLKTTAEYADPKRWIRRAMDTAIDLRAAHYLDGTHAIYGPGWRYRAVVVEIKFPHALSVVELDAETIEMGAGKLAYARAMWRASLDHGDWPAWSRGVVPVSAPDFHHVKWIEREGYDPTRRSHQPAAGASA